MISSIGIAAFVVVFWANTREEDAGSDDPKQKVYSAIKWFAAGVCVLVLFLEGFKYI
jgi:hypothetical protein